MAMKLIEYVESAWTDVFKLFDTNQLSRLFHFD